MLDILRSELGPDVIRTDKKDFAGHLGDWILNLPDVTPLALALPRSTAEVSIIASFCHRHGIPIVPQGGLTGLAGGAAPIEAAMLLSLARMRKIIEVDTVAATLTVEAGVPLEMAQKAAADADMLLPLDIGARGSSQIGGNLSTNAGGNRVLRYGMARELTLGLEVVLADGTVLSPLTKMLKNNAGYDIKQLFIGSEGTLGIITKAVLRLFPRPCSVSTALCALDHSDRVYDLLKRARASLGSALVAFEVMWSDYYKRALEHGHRPPFSREFPSYVLVEAMGFDSERDGEVFQNFLGEAIEAGVVADAVPAQSYAEAKSFWAIRDNSGEVLKELSPAANFDISFDVGRIDAFIAYCTAQVRTRWPDAVIPCFGHLADGNLHMMVAVPGARSFPEAEIEEVVYGCVREWGGSISAEHGIGLVKKPYLAHSRSPQEIALMKSLKLALDPKAILNPGKIFGSA